MAFTFKQSVNTGRLSHAEGRVTYVDIKIKRKTVGSLCKKRDGWQVGFRVVDETKPNGWSWLFLKGRHADQDIARKFVNDNFDAICDKWTLAPEV